MTEGRKGREEKARSIERNPPQTLRPSQRSKLNPVCIEHLSESRLSARCCYQPSDMFVSMAR